MSSSFLPYDLRVMALQRGFVFINDAFPLLSWKSNSKRKGWTQKAYRIQAASTLERLQAENSDLWDSGKVESSQSLYIPWGGSPLSSRQHVCWKVTLWDDENQEATSTEIGEFEVALQSNGDWDATWIYFDGNNPAASAPCPYFRKEFTCTKPVSRARLYLSARGLFEAGINGQRIGNDHFVPGWTDFRKRLQYLSYDVTELLQTGENALGVILGDGWYSSVLSCSRQRNYYGKYPELLLRLEGTYTDGTSFAITSGEGWKTTTGPILRSDLYDGEDYNAMLEMPGWDKPGFDDAQWRPARLGESAKESPILVQKYCDAVQQTEELKPIQVLHPHPDVTIYDFGQNVTGWVRFTEKSRQGQQYTLRFAEMLYPDGSLYNLNYRSARVIDYYTSNGEVTTWEPHFTFHGFRYVQIDGLQFCQEEGCFLKDVTAVVLHSKLEKSGDFHCGHPKVNQLFSNVSWGQRDNFLEIPTDCPQRDERLGWTGDAQIFCATAAFNRNVSAFFRKWLQDLRDSQGKDGAGAHIAPDIFAENPQGATAWADAHVICPWTMYQCYGDSTFLKDNYDSMKRWIEFQRTTSEQLIRRQESFGDWLALDPVKTPCALIGTAYFAYTTKILAQTAEILGKKEDATIYTKLAQEVKNAFRKEFLDEDGIVKTQNQTSCVLALAFDLLDNAQRPQHAALLKKLIEQNGNRLSTGFVGTPALLPALTASALNRTAYDLLLQEEFPSWLFSVNQGATTIWERWNSFTLDKGFGDVSMNSFNHYSYGAVAEWMAKSAAGLAYAAPGGKVLLFAAEPDSRLQFATASLETPYGKASSAWKFQENEWHWEIEAPANTSAIVRFPANALLPVTMDGKPVAETATENGKLTLNLPCGKYHFIVRLKES